MILKLRWWEPSVNSSERWAVMERGRWFVHDGTVHVQQRSDVEFTVLKLNSQHLRVSGVLFGCKDGCVLRPLRELPEGARSAKEW